MAATKLRLLTVKLSERCNIYNKCSVSQRLFCSMKESSDSEDSSKKVSGFAAFLVKQDEVLKSEKRVAEESFVTLLRNSKFISMGNPVEKIVIGEIYHIVGKDLYIDFGWKFPTVCSAPEKFKHRYVVGAKVKLRVKDLELASKFLGGEEEISLNEADCVLLGLADKPPKN